MIYVKTELGRTALRDKSLGLTPKQRSSFIMFDGKRSAAEVLSMTKALGVTADDVNHLVAIGLLAPAAAESALPKSGLTDEELVPIQPLSDSAIGQAGGTAATNSHQYAKAYPIAVRLTSNLGLRGFRLNLAVEGATDLEALKDIAPKIKEAVGVEKFRELEDALYR